MLKVRRSQDRLIFNMGIPILIRWNLYTETVPRSSAVMVLTMHYKWVIVIHKEGFQLPQPYQFWEMIENANIFLFLKINSAWLNLAVVMDIFGLGAMTCHMLAPCYYLIQIKPNSALVSCHRHRGWFYKKIPSYWWQDWLVWRLNQHKVLWTIYTFLLWW